MTSCHFPPDAFILTNIIVCVNITGDINTNVGRRRVVPIYTKIRGLVQKNYDDAMRLHSDVLFNDTLSRTEMKMTYDKYQCRLAAVVIKWLREDLEKIP